MPKKSSTNKSHFEQINLALAYIHNNFGENITAEDLANVSGYSIFHFHRVFKEITGENVNDYLRNTRLEKASNLLLYNQHQTIEEIAINSGFATAAGFRNAFKKKFLVSPKEWRKSGYDTNSHELSEALKQIEKEFDIKNPTIVNNEPIPMLYMLIYGYKEDMSEDWNHMREWCEEQDVLNAPHRYIGLFHNHPSFAKFNNSRYVACVETNEDVFRSGKVGKCVVSSGKFAKFKFECSHKDLYTMMHLAYINWLPKSKYEVRNFPAYVEFKNPEALFKNEVLEVDFYMPIQLKV